MATRKPNYAELHNTLSFIASFYKSVDSSSYSPPSLCCWLGPQRISSSKRKYNP